MSSYGRKTRSPGYVSGDHWVECQRCGFVLRSSEAKREWNGLIVCPEDYERRHPQDFVRGRTDDSAAKGLVTSETPVVEPANTGVKAIAGEAIAGIAVAGRGPESTIPTATFT